MGFLPGTEDITQLDAELIRATAAEFAQRGIGRDVFVQITTSQDDTSLPWRDLLRRLAKEVEASPAPEREWPGVLGVLGIDLLAQLVGSSAVSIRRYREGERETPTAVAARLHHVVLIISDLAGGYNEFGIRRWFGRRRAQLDHRAPADLLTGDWDPEDDGPTQVRRLAEALTAAPAT